MVKRIAYPAVFAKEDDGTYSVSFPDIEGCYTCGDDIADGMNMAEDALALMLYSNYEKAGKKFPKASDIKDILVRENEFVSYVMADLTYYRKKYGNKSVRKSVSIPEWMDIEAENAGISCSQVLQDAIREKLMQEA